MTEHRDENVTERICSRYGDEVDPGVTLKPDEMADVGHASELIERLAGRDVIGRYRLEGEVARGGQGAILRVWDGDLRRKLAMKVTLNAADEGEAHETDARTLGRFLEEAQVTGQLDHPGIVPVHELGLDSDGRVYFTMKLVKGRDLRAVFDLVTEGNEDWNQTRVLNVLLRVCEAMAYAHAKGVIHRDLKPGNVMVGRYGEVYVMDWGLARVLGSEDRKDIRVDADLMTTGVKSDRRDDADDVESPLLTMDGDVVGTPAYMPPEQAVGDLEAMGPHSDVYAVGAMLYHLLSGQVPYVEPGMRINNRVIWYMVQREPPTPLAKVAPGTPPELAAICDKAMARDPGQRYPDMLALAVDLRAFLENRVVGAYRTGALVEFKKWVQRNRGLAATAAAALVFALGGLGATTYTQKKANKDLGEQKALVDQQNLDLEEKNEELEFARNAALESEAKALWESYVGNIGAARADLALENVLLAKLRLERAPEKHRSWEWDHLQLSSDQSLFVIELPEGVLVNDVVYSPDGRILAAGCTDGNIRLWNGEGEAEIAMLAADEDNVYDFAFSPDGEHLAVGYKSGAVRLWEIATGEEEQLGGDAGGKAHESPVRNVLFNADGSRLATVPYSGQLALWSLPEKEGTYLDGASRPAFSPDGTRFAVARDVRLPDGFAPELVLFDAASAKELRSVVDPTGDRGVLALEFASDGRRLVAGGRANVSVWDTGEDEVAWRANHGQRVDWIYRAAFTQDGAYVVSSGSENTLRLWDAETGEQIAVSGAHRNFTPSFEFLPPSGRFVTASADSTIGIWAEPVHDSGTSDTKLELLAQLEGHAGWSTRLAVRPDGRRFATAADDGTIRIWSAATREPWTDLYLTPFMWCVAYDPSRPFLITSGLDRNGWNLQAFDMTAGVPFKLAELDSPAFELAYFPDGSALLVGAMSGRVVILDADGELLELLAPAQDERTVPSHPDAQPDPSVAVCPQGEHIAWVADRRKGLLRVRDLAAQRTLDLESSPPVNGIEFSPDGRVLASAHGDGRVRLWSVADGSELAAIDITGSRQGAVKCVAYSPDGRTLAVGCARADRNVTLVDVETHALRRLSGHNEGGSDVAFMPDGQRVVSAGGQDQTVRIWDVETGDPLLVLDAGDTVSGLAISPDGEEIAAAGNRLRVFHSSLGRALALQEALYDRELGWEFNVRSWEVIEPRAGRQAPSEYADAVAWAEIAVELMPQSQNAHHTLGLAYHRAGRHEDAVGAWLEADELLEDLIGAAAYYLRAQEIAAYPSAVGSATEALLRWCRRMLELAPGNPGLLNDAAWFVAAFPNRENSAYEAAVGWAQQAVTAAPAEFFILNTLGVAQFRVGQYTSALASLQRADEVNQERGDYNRAGDLLFVAMCQHELGLVEAMTTLEEARALVEAGPDPELERFLAEAEARIGE